MIPFEYLIVVIVFCGLVYLLCWGVASGVTAWSIRWAESRRLLAEVNDRSSHETPTPRLGGIGLVAGFLVGLVALLGALIAPSLPWILEVAEPVRDAERSLGFLPWAGIVGGLLLAFLLGLWDDWSNPPAVAKLFGQVAAALIPPLCGMRFMEIHLPGMEERVALAPWLGVVLSAGWILLLMNAVNFMDGINGLAGKFAVWVGAFSLLGAVGLRGGETLLILGPALMGAAQGFLRYNLPVARTFMGDCGSQPLGLIAAVLGIHLTTIPTTHPLPFLGVLLIVSVFLYDVLFTLARRAFQGKNLLQAHREHLYQRFLIAREENHRLTLAFLENHLILTGILGVLYLRWAFAPGLTGRQLFILALGAGVLIYYTLKVRRTEHAAAALRHTEAGS